MIHILFTFQIRSSFQFYVGSDTVAGDTSPWSGHGYYLHYQSNIQNTIVTAVIKSIEMIGNYRVTSAHFNERPEESLYSNQRVKKRALLKVHEGARLEQCCL